jgi:hypothetical protein
MADGWLIDLAWIWLAGWSIEIRIGCWLIDRSILHASGWLIDLIHKFGWPKSPLDPRP